MKVNTVTATGSEVAISLLPESEAEIALVQLMNGTDATCALGGGSVDSPTGSDDDKLVALVVTSRIKTRGY